jgi:enoyl-CoA hydratase
VALVGGRISAVPDVLLLDGPHDGVATLTLNRPDRKNALSIELRDAISDAFDALTVDESVKVIVVAGAGDAFCSGFDLKEFAVEDVEFQARLWATSDRYHHTVLCSAVPTVAAIDGPALAGGFDLAVLCDLRVATDRSFFAHPEQSFGDVVYGPLADLVGGAVARDLCLTGRRIDAAEALRVGLVSQVVSAADLAPAIAEVTSAICRAPRENLLRTKAKALRRAGVDPAAGTLDL